MGKFNAEEEVEDLTYDFGKFGGGSGEIPEPTSDQVEDYRRAFYDSIKGIEFDDEGNIKTDDLDALLVKNKEAEGLIVEATAMLTGVTAEVLWSLPYRVRQAFLGWIMGVFLHPED